MKPLTHELVAALADLDVIIPGLGLYASFEYLAPAGKTHPYWKVEWEMALRPRLEKLGCTIDQTPVFGKTTWNPSNALYTFLRFRTPNGQVCDLRMVRTSHVNVRRYGSGYHVDRTVDFADRWAQLKMDKHIRQLWWPDRYQMSADIRLVLFLGFDKANRPFHKEMTALEKTSRWPERNIIYKSKSWPDAYDRDFNILAACWASTKI